MNYNHMDNPNKYNIINKIYHKLKAVIYFVLVISILSSINVIRENIKYKERFSFIHQNNLKEINNDN